MTKFVFKNKKSSGIDYVTVDLSKELSQNEIDNLFVSKGDNHYIVDSKKHKVDMPAVSCSFPKPKAMTPDEWKKNL
ncbi:MAG: hypothetical protein ACOCUI_00200 [bacterium]